MNAPLRHAAFATVTAVVMLGLLGVAMAALSVTLSMTVRRTRVAAEDAQLRQMMLAAAVDVSARGGRWADHVDEASWDVPLPPLLADEGAHLTVNVVEFPDGRVGAHIVATLSGRSAEQDIVYARTSDRWGVQDVALGR